MSKDEFLKRKKEIEDKLSKLQEIPAAFRDQRISDLYCESNWTQREIAEVEGINFTQVSRLLLFRKFLAFLSPDGRQTTPKNLTERRFRGYWEKTSADAGDLPRFKACVKMLEEDVTLRAGNSDQRACVAVEALPMFEEEAKGRKVESGKRHGRGKK